MKRILQGQALIISLAPCPHRSSARYGSVNRCLDTGNKLRVGTPI